MYLLQGFYFLATCLVLFPQAKWTGEFIWSKQWHLAKIPMYKFAHEIYWHRSLSSTLPNLKQIFYRPDPFSRGFTLCKEFLTLWGVMRGVGMPSDSTFLKRQKCWEKRLPSPIEVWTSEKSSAHPPHLSRGEGESACYSIAQRGMLREWARLSSSPSTC